MNKRHFLGAVAAAGALPSLAVAAPKSERGPALLTVTGAIAKPNRGSFDRVADQMMQRQHLSFDKAFTFDFAALAAMPSITIKPTLEYDSRPHTLSGPLLADVLKAAGAQTHDNSKLLLRAVDGYAAAVPMSRVKAQRYIVATHLDGAPMALGGLGPLWAIYDADRVPEMASKPVGERFGACPWALYHIEVQA
ncbi:molybdopterin-dependent oxidoreductase [Pseudoduganella violaceinigra]|uniref:molybdopterin-dependent oxidoreductase n=1 Tax=Pseudoduganella violaceinigra TaxID=246602 RepID=UPI0003FA52BE|nr:molybdopterin-dependent oxidoreductase [Pseudoduganella violaceinigra]